MWHRTAAAILLLRRGLTASAQVNNVYSNAVPPDKAAMERLNLKIEWTAYIPVEGRRDSLTQIQTIDDQIFVQTRTGLLIAGDALTGRLQWVGSARQWRLRQHLSASRSIRVRLRRPRHQAVRVPPLLRASSSSSPTWAARRPLDWRPTRPGLLRARHANRQQRHASRLTVYNLPRPIAIPDAPEGPARPELPPPDKGSQGGQPGRQPHEALRSRSACTRTKLPDVFDTPQSEQSAGSCRSADDGRQTPVALGLAANHAALHAHERGLFAVRYRAPVVAAAISTAERLPERHPAIAVARDDSAVGRRGAAPYRSATARTSSRRSAGSTG